MSEMKVYAVTESNSDDYSDFDVVVGDYVYLKEEDAKKKLEELIKKDCWSEFKIREFEVKG